MYLRPTYRINDASSVRDGHPFTIIGFYMLPAEEVVGDHPEPMFAIRYDDGAVNEDVNAACIFTGYSEDFDNWCAMWPPSTQGEKGNSHA